MIISPSVLSLHYDEFKKEVEALNENVEWLHFDVMDGHFVPNLTFGPDIFGYFRKNSDLFMDVHLMVTDPSYYSDVFAKKGADLITFHYEALDSLEAINEVIDKIHSYNIKAGISIKPNTNVEVLQPILDKIDLVLVMSVEPGFGGQKFMDSSLDKIKWLSDYKNENNLNYHIEVDGGINDQTAHLVLEKGCDVLVAGSYVFKGDIASNVAKLRNCK